MAIKIISNFVIEDIVDMEGNKLGELKFNPSDTRIMEKLTGIVTMLNNSLKKLDAIKNVDENLLNRDAETLEDFEKTAEVFETLHQGFEIENNYTIEIIDGLKEIFGNETINIITQGTNDVESVFPIFEFIMPYVQQQRAERLNKYLKKNTNSDVME